MYFRFQGNTEEEDCYADIMKDDIIKLDDSSFNESPRPLQVTAINPKSEMKSKQPAEATLSVLPFQGTANRRLRLRRQRLESDRKEQFEIYKFDTRDIPIENNIDSHSQQGHESLIDNFPISRIKVPFVFLFLVIMLILLLLFLDAYWYGYYH